MCRMWIRKRLSAKALIAVLALLALGACSRGGGEPADVDALRAAADATAKAHSFTATAVGIEATYVAPDRYEQVEHGQAEGVSASSDGSSTTSGPHPETITKRFIGDRYYEASGPDGATPDFTVATLGPDCAKYSGLAETVVHALGDIAAGAKTARVSGDTFTFTTPSRADPSKTLKGTVTASGGWVTAITFDSTTRIPAVTIGSVNRAPPIEVPASASPSTYSCSP
jgi:hypothetical protein